MFGTGWWRAGLKPGAAITVAALAGASLVTIAGAHQGDTSLIHACVSTASGGGASAANSGNVRIVGANDSCRSGETALHWSQTSSGDITGVVAGTGLAGGGSSGEVTLRVAIPLELTGSTNGSIIEAANSSSFGTGLTGKGSIGVCGVVNGHVNSGCSGIFGSYAGMFQGDVIADGTFIAVSDRAAKENFADIDPRQVLEKLLAIPITSWTYRSDNASIRHVGPVAQDFAAAFSVGQDDKHIATVDADGVALAAIQGLALVVQEKDAQLAVQGQRLADLEQQNASLEVRLAAIEERLLSASTR